MGLCTFPLTCRGSWIPSCQAVQSAFSQGGVGSVPPPATQQGKKNARARQVSLFSWVKGAGIDRAEAARAWLSLALVARGLVCQPLGLVSTPGLSLALDNCVGAIDVVMLYNAYIISHGDSFLSVLRSH